MDKEPSFIVQKFNGFSVIRDDLFEGGTKRRAFQNLIHTINEPELVYACDYYGHAAYAVALTALEVGRPVMLFYLSPQHDTSIFRRTTSLPNVQYKIVEGAKTQIEASNAAIEYAKEHAAKFLTIGLDFPEFGNELEKVVKSANIKAPEIWCMGGSGALARALQKAYPDIPVKVVSVGTANGHFEGTDKVYAAPEKLDEEAEIRPPYNSSAHYDAKVWRFVIEHAKPEALIWNVA